MRNFILLQVDINKIFHHNQNIAPASIKDTVSIQKLFFQPCTKAHFRKISSIFFKHNCMKFNKTHLFLAFFKVRLLFKCVVYWRGCGISMLCLNNYTEDRSFFGILANLPSLLSQPCSNGFNKTSLGNIRIISAKWKFFMINLFSFDQLTNN